MKKENNDFTLQFKVLSIQKLNSKIMIAKSLRLYIILFVISIILFIPLVAMQFTTEVNWTSSDFIIAGILLFSTGLLVELAIRKIKETNLRILLILGIILILFLVWAELAVGIFGTRFAGS